MTKISACIITRDEPLLAQAVASVRPYVDEVVIVDTGSKEPQPQLADNFEIFTECNDIHGRIANFALARQRSFDLASNDCVMWLDADDEVYGLENLWRSIEHANALSEEEKFSDLKIPVRYIAPYEYAYDANGKCVALQPRERIFTDRNAFKWVNRVHEGVTTRPGHQSQDLPLSGIVWKHRRKGLLKDRDRNLRILLQAMKDEVKLGGVTHRTRFDLAHETYLCGLHLQSLPIIENVIASADSNESKAQAALWLVDLHSFYKNWSKAEKAAEKAIELLPHNSIGYYAMARIHYRWADVEMEASHLLKSIEYGTKGLDIPEFPTFLLYNPQDETRNIPMLVADAAHRVLDPATERDMLDRMIKADPDDSSLYLRLAGCLSA